MATIRQAVGLGLSILLLALTIGTGPTRAQTASFEGLSAPALQRLGDAPGLARALEGAPGGRIPVIVEVGATGAEGLDQAPTAQAVRQAQSDVLDRVLRASDGSASGIAIADPALNLRLMQIIPVLALSADEDLLRRLAEDPGVVRIWSDVVLAPALNASRGRIGVGHAIRMGATGEGWSVAVLDTGARRSHEFLTDRIVAAACYNTNDSANGFSSLCAGGATQALGLDSANDCDPGTLRGCGHGTHVSGIAAGYFANSRTSAPAHGVARNAGIVSINVFSRVSPTACRRMGVTPGSGQQGCVLAMSSDLLRGLERVYELRHQHRIAAVNMSLAGGGYTGRDECDRLMPPLTQMVERLHNAGIITVAAAGNNGFNDAVGWPACMTRVVSVGNAQIDDVRFSSSNWGPLVDLVAPGRSIQSAVVNGRSNNSYGLMTGTSMAAPHVAGAIVALRSVNPDASPDQLIDALRRTGTAISSAGVSRPRINLDRAAERLLPDPAPVTLRLDGPETRLPGVPLTVSVLATSPRGIPQGSVTLRRDGTAVASAALDTEGRARFTLSELPPGTHWLTAHFAGTNLFAAARSEPLELEVFPPVQRPLAFVGGGSLFGFTDQCQAGFGGSAQAVAVAYHPGEADGPASEVSIVWRDGSEHLSVWGPLVPDTAFVGGAGRQSWSRFVFYPGRPLIRTVQRQLVSPSGVSNVVDAQEVLLRLRIQNFGAIRSCATTLVATLRRM